MHSQYFKFLMDLRPTKCPNMSIRRVVVVTGCDSGLGWAAAAAAARAGLVTVAGMRSPTESEARSHLVSYSAHTVQLDVTDNASVENFRAYVRKLLHDNPNYRLYAVINNAGVMTAGEFEWLTPSMIESQLAVNLLGAMRVTSALLPDLRRAAIDGTVKPRLINIGSHCGVQPLPCFAVYSASKSGVIAFTRALRIELQPYGVRAVTVLPGGFVTSSRIMSRQGLDFDAMAEQFDDEQKSFYTNKLAAVKNYLCVRPAHYSAMDSGPEVGTVQTVMKAITDENPKLVYKTEPWRYKFYFYLFMLPLPEFLHNWLINRFLMLPTGN